MEGDRLITVRFYGPGEATTYGDNPRVLLRSVQTWGRKTDLGGTERPDELAVVSEQKARWRVRASGLEGVNTGCEIVDDLGGVWDITAITEPPGQRGVWFDLHAALRT